MAEYFCKILSLLGMIGYCLIVFDLKYPNNINESLMQALFIFGVMAILAQSIDLIIEFISWIIYLMRGE